MTELNNLNNANISAGRVNDFLIREGVADRVVYTSSVCGTLNFEVRFIGRAQSFSLTKGLFDEFRANGFKIVQEYIDWADKEFVIRLIWIPRYVRPQTEEEKAEAMRMVDAIGDAVQLRGEIMYPVDYMGAKDGRFYFNILIKMLLITTGDDIEISEMLFTHIRNSPFNIESVRIGRKLASVAITLVWVGDADG